MSAPSHPSDLPKAAVDALWQGNKIEAITVLRQERNIGLKEAKDQVDAYVRSQPSVQAKLAAAQAEAKQGCVRWLIVALALLAIGYFFLVAGK